MTVNLQDILNKLKELELRIGKIENILSKNNDDGEDKLMRALYEKAKALVIRHGKSTPTFLQKKLFIDYARAERIIRELKDNGIV